MIYDTFYQVFLSTYFSLSNGWFWNENKSLNMMIIEDNTKDFLEMCYLLKQKVNIELFLTLLTASMIFLHCLPIQNDIEFSENIEN